MSKKQRRAKKTKATFDFLLEPKAQFENRVRPPLVAAKKRVKQRVKAAKELVETEVTEPTRDVMNVMVVGGVAAAAIAGLFYAYRRFKK